MSSPLHQQDEPLGMEDRINDEPNRISNMMKGDRLSSKKKGQLLEDFYRRSSPIMDLPMSTSSNIFREKRRLRKANNEEDSRFSFIDGILDVIDYDYRVDCDQEEESDDEVMIVPVKLDNYVNKRSRLSKTNQRRKELLLDNGLAITEALRALDMEELVISSEDEVSIEAEDIDN